MRSTRPIPGGPWPHDMVLRIEDEPRELTSLWRDGLESIVQLPYAGFFAERIDPATLVVSRVARHDPELYRRALAAPMGGGPQR